MRVLIYRLLASVSFFVFALALIGTGLGTVNGTSETFVTLFRMLANPTLALQYPTLIWTTAFKAAIQLLMIYMFYFLGRWFWRRSIPHHANVIDMNGVSEANNLAAPDNFAKQEKLNS